ncbi:hypothetical protein JZ751_000729 [Albula glossodonta]|uniref:Uncharacterized protein n=1 Tax=Albula glossodonta TaxID=121402 RepID=A0A8T2PX07_9TELE|nr:hypothetical protein JZ751_000729 [Albula glossodonta]
MFMLLSARARPCDALPEVDLHGALAQQLKDLVAAWTPSSSSALNPDSVVVVVGWLTSFSGSHGCLGAVLKRLTEGGT